jgi:cell division protein FtsQ
VTITVTQVTPVAVAHDGRGFALVNGGGEPYRTVPSRPDGLPLADVQVAQLPDAAAAAAVDVAAALGSVHSALLRREVDRVQATDPLDVTVVLADGTRVTWGSSVGSAAKARTLQLLLRAHPQASAYDVSAPATPSITP